MKNLPYLLTALALVLAPFARGQAQSANANSQGKAQSLAQSVDKPGQPDFATVLGQAKQAAKAKNLNAAEQALTPLNHSLPDTAEWRFETANRLGHLAQELARDGDPETATALANQALQHLKDGGALAKDVRQQAGAKTAAGFLFENYLGDHAAAIAQYQAAVQLDPTDKPAQEALRRLQESTAIAQARIKANQAKK